MTVIRRRFLVSFIAPLLLAACASPQSRIDDHPDTFQALSVEQQALVKQGKIAIGFSEDAVKLALGPPQRVTQRTDEKGKSTVWRYVDYDAGAVGGFVGAGYYPGFGAFSAGGRPIGFYNGFYGPGFPAFYAGGPSVERDRIRVVFVDGKVTSIDEEVK